MKLTFLSVLCFSIMLLQGCSGKENNLIIPLSNIAEDTLLFFPYAVSSLPTKEEIDKDGLPGDIQIIEVKNIVFQEEMRKHTDKLIKVVYGKLDGREVYVIDTDNDGNFQNEQVYDQKLSDPPYIKISNYPFMIKDKIEKRAFHIKYTVHNMFSKQIKAFNALPIYKSNTRSIDSIRYTFALNNYSSGANFMKQAARLVIYENQPERVRSNNVLYGVGDTIYLKNIIYLFKDILGYGDSIVLSKIGTQKRNFGVNPGDYLFTQSGKDIKTGDNISFNAANKYVLLDFWGTWCGPCLELTEDLREIDASYGDKGLKLIGVAFDDDPSEPAKYIKRKNILWPNVFDDRDSANLVKKFTVSAFPTFILTDKKGKIVIRGTGFQALDSVKSYLKTNLK